MPTINHSAREITSKIVYCGPGLSGKSTNLYRIYGSSRLERRSNVVSLTTGGPRDELFEFFRVTLGSVGGFETRLHLYTVPGQLGSERARRRILAGVDGICFVADSEAERMEANLESLESLRADLRTHGKDLDRVTHVFQYNKRDLPRPVPMPRMSLFLNDLSAPEIGAVATTGEGVVETFRQLTRTVLTGFGAHAPRESRRQPSHPPPP